MNSRIDPKHITETSQLSKSDVPANTAYRSQFWRIPADHRGIFVAVGMFGQYCYVNPATQLVVVKLSSHQEGNVDTINWEFRVFEHIAESLTEK